jgi:pyruvate kinase
MKKRTKIIASLGPSTSTGTKLEKMMLAGTDVFRINLSHTSIEDAKTLIDLVRSKEKKMGRPVAVMIDLQGQKIRIKGFSKKTHITLKTGDNFIINADLNDNGSQKQVGITYKDLYKNVYEGDELLLSDALIKLRVNKIQSKKIHTTVERGGKLKPHQGLNKKGGGLSLSGITAKDKSDLKKSLSYEYDYIAVSFVKDEKDILAIKNIIKNKDIKVIAKIERNEALKNIDKITKASDGLLVARGDLGVEIGIEQLPAAQRFLIRKAISFDKLAIVATQMMESMITNRVPTRAEVFDVANAVTSGVDAIMFSAETAIGKYPTDVINEASRICAESEGAYIRPLSVDRVVPKTLPVDQVIALSAVYSAKLTKVVAIAALTETGSTALWMSRVQSNIPIYAMTQNVKTARRICLYKGVQSIKLDKLEENHAQANMQVIGLMKKIGTVKKGDLVIITKGDLLGTSGGTNAMKVVEVGNMLEIND